MTVTPEIFEQLQVINQERLRDLLTRRHLGLAFDVHGFIRGKDTLAANDRCLEALADKAAAGASLAAITGYGDRIHAAVTVPLAPKLRARGIDPNLAQIYLSTRNGALTTHAFTDELVAAHPLTDVIYSKITAHPLVQALQNLTPTKLKAEMAQEYANTERELRLKTHPRRLENPGLRHDWHNGTEAGYQLTALYIPRLYELIQPTDAQTAFLDMIREFSGGTLPATTVEMAALLRAELERDGVLIDTQTAVSHPEIDMVCRGVDKSVGAAAVTGRVAAHWQLSKDEVRQLMVGGGDSFLENDGPLIRYFGQGVTNIGDLDIMSRMDAPVYLDFPEAQNQIEKTAMFIEQMRCFD